MNKNNVTFDYYQSSKNGQKILVSTELNPTAKLAEDTRVFDKTRYNQEIHSPVYLNSTGNYLKHFKVRCLDMPLRLAGQQFYYIPEEWHSLLPLIINIITTEQTNNPHWSDYYTYLTVDSSYVEKENQQRNSGLHVDGFQGARINPKTKITRNYVATSNGGTRFYPQLFDADIDDSTYNIFEGFDMQAGEPVTAPENTVCFMDAYTVHESGYATQTGLRTFIRVTYDMKPFDREGNTRNMMLDKHPDYQWDMMARTVHETLQRPPSEIFTIR